MPLTKELECDSIFILLSFPDLDERKRKVLQILQEKTWQAYLNAFIEVMRDQEFDVQCCIHMVRTFSVKLWNVAPDTSRYHR